MYFFIFFRSSFFCNLFFVATKSTIVLDVKPWEAETDMKALEAAVRALQFDGLIWGRSELKEVGYGVKKLQIQIVVEDEKVMWDDVEEQILALEEYVQSCDIQAWNKI